MIQLIVYPMKTVRTFMLIELVAAFFISCAGSEKLAYMQTMKGITNNEMILDTAQGLHEAHIKPQDILSITVVTSESSASRGYNLMVPQIADLTNVLYSSPVMQSYLVENNGKIDFPLIGKFYVAGLSRKELEEKIQKEIEPSFSKERPIITIRIINYSVNILGEVSRPGKYSTANDRLTIFEGLALAGDMTIYGRRDNVKVIRENIDGSKTCFYANLNDKSITQSPAYYLEQNDVVYVEPNKSRSRSSNVNAAETLTISAFSILLSLINILVTVLR